MTERVVVLLDMDCFYVQVEERDHPQIKGQPAAVVQYNTWKGGGIIAVNYEARAFGVKRGMRGDEARARCADIHLVQVPVNRGKADLTKYREAGKEVINVLCEYSSCVERASIDEAYIDFTSSLEQKINKFQGTLITSQMLKSTWVVGYDSLSSEEEIETCRQRATAEWLSSIYENYDPDVVMNSEHPQWDNLRLAHAAVVCEEMRAAVLARTGFKCSAGIAHNKVLGKLSCGLHKPNQQTVLPQCQVGTLWQNLEVGKVRNLGGKLGDSLTEELGCKTMGDLARLSLLQLQGRYDSKTAFWLYNMGQGIDSEPVTSRQLPKSIGCGKNFLGREALNTRERVAKWMRSLAEELTERLELDQQSNKRRAKSLTVSVRLEGDDRWTSLSRTCALPTYSMERITHLAISLIQHTNTAGPRDPIWKPAINNISLSAGKFEDNTGGGSADIQQMFMKVAEAAQIASSKSAADDRVRTLANEWEGKISKPSQQGDPSEVKGLSPLHHYLKKESKSQNKVCLEEENKSDVSSACPDPEKVASLSNKTPEQKSVTGNSFFRNFILQKQQKDVNLNLKNDGINQDEVLDDGENKSEEDTSEEDLDLLVNQLDDDDLGSEGVKSDHGKVNETFGDGLSDNGSVYNASTDIDSCVVSDDDSPRLKEGDQLDKVKSVPICREPDRSIPVLSSRDNVNEKSEKLGVDKEEDNDRRKTNEKPNRVTGRNDGENGNCAKRKNLSEYQSIKIEDPELLVQELFPNLNDVDESLLPLLPKELQVEVKKAFLQHKAKTGGMWKYMSGTSKTNVLGERNRCKSTSAKVSPKSLIGNSFHSSEVDQSLAGPSGHCITTKKTTNQSILDTSNESATESVLDKDEHIRGEAEEEEEEEEAGSQDMVTCEECKVRVSAFELPEHLDYHMALKLQTEMSKCDRAIASLPHPNRHTESNRRSKGKKRGKSCKGSAASTTDNKVKKIDSFFK